MAASRHEGGLHVAGAFTCTSLGVPAGSVRNAGVAADAAIDASKLLHQYTVDRELFESATTVVAKTELLKIVRGATGTVVAFEAAVVTIATGADRTVNVDLQKSTGGGAFATILTGTILLDDGSTNLVPVAGVINTPGLVDGDLLRVVVTVAGAAGNQAIGLVATLTMIETPA